MKCPHCGLINHNCRVVDSRPYRDTVKRTRLCEHCNRKWRTFELEQDRYQYFLERDKTGRRLWLDGEEKTLVLYREQGKTYKELGELFGRSKESVRVKVMKLRDSGRYFDILEELEEGEVCL